MTSFDTTQACIYTGLSQHTKGIATQSLVCTTYVKKLTCFMILDKKICLAELK